MRLSAIAPSTWIFVVFVLLVFASPMVLSGPQQSLATRALIFGLMAASLDIAYGHTGLASLGHASLAGVGGYTAALLMVKHDIESFWLGAGAAVRSVSAIVAAVFGVLALRAKGIYFILVTFTLGQMLASLAQQWGALKSPGVDAVVGVSLPTTGLIDEWSTSAVLRGVLIVVVVAFALIIRTLGSPFGLALRGTRDNPARMAALGYNVWAYQLGSLIVAGAFAGLAGALFAYHSGIIAPNNVGIAASGLLVLMVILGGSGTLYGAFAGGILMTIVQFYAGEFSERRAPLVIGAIFIGTALFLRGGIAGAIRRNVRWGRGDDR